MPVFENISIQTKKGNSTAFVALYFTYCSIPLFPFLLLLPLKARDTTVDGLPVKRGIGPKPTLLLLPLLPAAAAAAAAAAVLPFPSSVLRLPL